jgi:hypothetical protein
MLGGVLAAGKTTQEEMMIREQNPPPERITPLEEAACAVPGPECPLKVGLMYQDSLTQEWARRQCERLATRAGKPGVHCQAWMIGGLSDPDVFARTLLEAEGADIMAVAIQDAEQLPPAFYVLMDTWSRHRSRPTGALLTLLGGSQNADDQAQRAEGFLRTIARQGDLKSLNEPRELSA